MDYLGDEEASTAARATAGKVLRQIAKLVAVIDDFPVAGRTRDETRARPVALTRAGLPRPHNGFTIHLAGTASLACHHKILQLKYEERRTARCRACLGRADHDHFQTQEDKVNRHRPRRAGS